jgi:hypothetical protein
MHWLVIGGGPEAYTRWQESTADKIITSNRGLQWCPHPDAYWVTDPNAVERYRAQWGAYDGEIISNSASVPNATPWEYMSKGLAYHGRSSGILACRVALERGASKLTLVGFQGHNWNDERRDINDKPAGTYGGQADKRNEAMARAFENMADGYPDVVFEFVGETRIQLPQQFVRVP